MKIDPDGFPRITSSGESVHHHAKIIEVPDDEGGYTYKPVWIADENESESEKSEEEPWSDDDIPNIELSVENVPDIQLPKKEEETKDVEPQVAEQKPEQKKNRHGSPQPRKEHRKYNRKQSPHNQHMYKPSKRYFRNFHKKSGNSNKYNHIPNTGFGASSSFVRNYPTPTSGNIEPWFRPPVIINTPETFPYPSYQFPCTSSVQNHNVEGGRASFPCPSVQNHNVEGGRNSIGLLGDTPYFPKPHNFVPSRQNMHNQNCWINEYPEYSLNDYHRKPRLAPLRGGSGQGTYQRKPKNRNKDWRGKGKYRN